MTVSFVVTASPPGAGLRKSLLLVKYIQEVSNRERWSRW
jgi:hypothetical protein